MKKIGLRTYVDMVNVEARTEYSDRHVVATSPLIRWEDLDELSDSAIRVPWLGFATAEELGTTGAVKIEERSYHVGPEVRLVQRSEKRIVRKLFVGVLQLPLL
ncbi:MAG: hypothetical protein ACP5J3_00995 [Pyrobaculum sp.]